jgi:hypothetical protein
MHPVIFAAALGTQLLIHVSDNVPKLNVEATCKGSVESDKAMGLALPQSFDKCMSDENSALEQLRPIWPSYSASIQNSCIGEATGAGSDSYVDLLTCLQMNGGPNAITPATNLRGGSKRKPAN